MKTNVWVIFLLLVFLTLFPIFFLYRQLGTSVVSREDFLRYQNEYNSSPNESRESFYCMQFPEDMLLYPNCFEKILWLRNGWKTHRCYADYGVNGSICSMRRYLSEVENHCPPVSLEGVEPNLKSIDFAQPNTDLKKLFLVLDGNSGNYDYIKDRLTQYWSSWIEALDVTLFKYPKSTSNRRRLNILIHLGLLTEANLHIGEKSRNGGPLGELLQWSDLIACLFLLGHNLYISNDKPSLIRHVDKFPFDGPCPSKQNHVDLIITDIIGLRSFRTRREFLLRNKCLIRLVDSFGTHVEFNYRSYFKAHSADFAQKGGTSTNPWGGHGLKLLQHWTFFPHTPDNDFLGFAIHRPNVEPLYDRETLERPLSLVYGKEKYMWTESEPVIEVLKSLTEVHATVADLKNANESVFLEIVNHGFLNTTEIAALLKSVNIFVGLGFPFEGPAPLEAVAHGAVFINPKFEPPKNRLNTPFFRDKPTLREFTSQSPYMERIGAPHVYTVNFNNTDELRNAIIKALSREPQPFVPEEFTPEGMLIRVNMLIHRDLCTGTSRWPPRSAFVPKLGAPGDSCEMACRFEGFVCEPSFFPLINLSEFVASIAACSPTNLMNSTEPHAPYNCSRQINPLMFSCATRPPTGSNAMRVCPCRDYVPGQMAFCKECVS
nr:GLY-2 [Haemonchus contortus]